MPFQECRFSDFQNITLHSATNSVKSQAKIKLGFHFVERNKQMIEKMAIAIALPGLKLSWTFGDPYFSFDGSFSLPIFFV